MKILVQRSLESSVTVHQKMVGSIKKGLVVFVGFQAGDTITDIDYGIHKLIHLRIFEDDGGKMNHSILEIKGSILSISQFTLCGNCEKGNRPSYTESLPYEQAKEYYQIWNQKLKQYVPVEEGIFGADMKVNILNDGPVTLWIESRRKDDKK